MVWPWSQICKIEKAGVIFLISKSLVFQNSQKRNEQTLVHPCHNFTGPPEYPDFQAIQVLQNRIDQFSRACSDWQAGGQVQKS